MADTEFRTLFKNDTAMARLLDGDDDWDYASSSSRTAVASTHSGGGLTGSLGGSYNTGPKGVQSDARAFRASQSAQSQSPSMSSHTPKVRAQTWSEEGVASDARDRWVEKRLKELSKSRTLERVSGSQFLQYVETVPAVLVLIDDVDNDESSEFVQAVAGLVGKYAAVKMIVLACSEADMDAVVAPAVQLYEDGNLSVNVMRVTDEMQTGDEIGQRSVEEVLLKVGALKRSFRLDRE